MNRRVILLVASPLAASLAGMAYVGLGMVMLLTRGVPCMGTGCKVVQSYASHGELPVMVLGMVFFAVLSAFIYMDMKEIQFIIKPKLAAKVMLVSALGVEGYLVGFQVFVAHAVCLFCMGMLAMVAITAVSYTFGKPVMYVGTAVFFAVIAMMFLVRPYAGIPTSLDGIADNHIVKGSPPSRCYLFYSRSCEHCEKVIDYCESTPGLNIDLYTCPVSMARGLLASLGIDRVPTLLVDNGGTKEIITGDRAIISYLELSSLRLRTWKIPGMQGGSCPGDRPCGEDNGQG